MDIIALPDEKTVEVVQPCTLQARIPDLLLVLPNSDE
jgi:hypothetical protein